MDRIIENDVNAGFLEEARRRGYRPYINVFQAACNETTPGFYMGSMQLTVRDEFGVRYYIGLDMWNWTAFRKDLGKELSVRAEVQFHADGEKDTTVDVAISHKGFSETEAFYHDMWHKMSFGRAEED